MKKNIPLTPEERTEALKRLAAGESFRAVGKALNRAPNSIRKIANDPKALEEIMAERERIAGKFQKLAERLVDGITDQQIDKAPLGTRVLASCQAIDKAELLRGQNRDKGVNIKIAIVTDPRYRPDMEGGNVQTIEINGEEVV